MFQNVVTEESRLMPLLTAVFLLTIIVLLALLYQLKRKQKKQLEALKFRYDAELKHAQERIREETLSYIGAELHDHIGQLLAVVKLNLALHKDPKLNETHELVARIIKDMRDLVHAMNSENIERQDLAASISREVERLSRLSYAISCHIHSEPYLMGPQKQIGIFRIFQECISNIIKHSAAKNIAVELYFDENLFTLVIRDDGEGFDNGSPYRGLGLQHMEQRARLLGGALSVDTSPGTGCHIMLTIHP